MEHLKQYFTIAYWRDLVCSFGRAMKTLKFWRELLMMTAGMSVGAAAVYYFLMPSHLIVGSISGLSIVINTIFCKFNHFLNLSFNNSVFTTNLGSNNKVSLIINIHKRADIKNITNCSCNL